MDTGSHTLLRRGGPVILCVLFLTATPTRQSLAADEVGRLIEEQVRTLGTVPTQSLDRVTLGPHGKHYAYVVTEVGGTLVVHDGRRHKTCDEVSQLTFSPDGRNLLYLAQRGEQVLLVRNGRFMPLESTLDETYISPGALHVAYETESFGRRCLVLDGRKGELYDIMSDVIFSANGRSVAFKGTQGGIAHRSRRTGPSRLLRGERRASVVINNRELRRHMQVHSFAFSPDGMHITMWTTHKEEIELFFDNRSVKEVTNAATQIPPLVSPNNGTIAYVVRSGGNLAVVCGNRRGPDCLHLSDLVFSRDSRHLAYRAQQPGGWQIVHDNKAGPLYAEVGPPVFSPRARHLAYWARNATEHFVVCDGTEGPKYDRIVWVGFSFDDKHLLYLAKRGDKKLIVCDGAEGPPHNRLWIPNACRIATRKLRYVVLDRDGETLNLVETAWPGLPR